jgi:hypothetical protein
MKTSDPRTDMGGQLKSYVLDYIECSHHSVVRVGEDDCEMDQSSAIQDLEVPTQAQFCDTILLLYHK